MCPLPNSLTDREQDKFELNSGGKTAVRTISEVSGSVSGSFAPSGLNIGGLITEVPLVDSAWTALPASPLANRNNITVQNNSGNGNVIMWNYVNSVGVTIGFRIEDGGHKSVAIRDTILVYGRMLSGTGTALVDEVA